MVAPLAGPRAWAAVLLLVAGLPGFLAAQTTSPLHLARAALARHQVVFLGDVHPFAEPKRLIERLVGSQDEGARVDLLVLEVGSEHQGAIDGYLASAPEDVAHLLSRPRTLRAHWGASAEYLAIYRAVYRWNRTHPTRPVRILAADLAGWPPAPGSESAAADAFAHRDRWMAGRVREVLTAHPAHRTLVFMGGYHGLKAIGGRITIGRATASLERWLGGYLADAGMDVYTILTDARQPDGTAATRLFERLAAGEARDFALELDTVEDHWSEPLREVRGEGFALEFRPTRFALRDAADALLVLTRPTPTTLVRLAR